MNLDELEKKILAAARRLPTSDRVPCAFEKRVMAALSAAPADPWALWSLLLWRAAAPCVGIMLALGIWSVAMGISSNSSSLAADLERTVLAPLASLNDSW